MKYTQNLLLRKPGYDDPVDIKEFNENADILDKSIKNISDKANDSENQIRTIKDQIATMSQNIKEIDEESDLISSKLEENSQIFSDEITAIKSNATNLSNKISEIERKHVEDIQALEDKYSESGSGDIVILDDIADQLIELQEKHDADIAELNKKYDDISAATPDSVKDLVEDVAELKSNKELVDNRLLDIDERLENISETIDGLPDQIDKSEVIDIRTGYDGTIYERAGDAVRALGEEIRILAGSKVNLDVEDLGLEQDAATGFVYPTYQGVRSSKGIMIVSGDTSTVFKLRSTTDSLAFSVASGSPVILSYTFSSIDAIEKVPTGNGTASYYINDELIASLSIPQGEIQFNCTKYLKSGENTVRVDVTDADGETRSLTWNINCIEIYITSNFDYTFPYESDITYKYTAYGEIKKTIHFILDGFEQPTDEIESTGRQNTKVFEGLAHGLHTLEVYATAELLGSHIESTHLRYDIIVVGNSVTPIISINNVKNEIVQGEILDIPYIVYDPLATESTVELSIYSIDETGKATLYNRVNRTVNRALQHWSTRDYPVGTVRFTVTLREISRSTMITVSGFSLPISPATNDLELHLTSANRSNTETNPAVWTYNDITTTFSKVNWASSGWVVDEEGDTALHLAGGTSATIKFKPFSEDLRIYGKTLEFDFAVRDVNNRDAQVISCRSGGVGILITADEAALYSSLSSVRCKFNDESRIRVAFVIESRSEYRLMSIYLNGVLTKTEQYVSTDSFSQSTPVDIHIGSPYCAVDLYTVRSYRTALSQEELLSNYICDIVDINEKTVIYENNDIYDSARNLVYEKVKTKIPVMTITGPLPASKGDKKDVYISYEDFRDDTMNFYDRYCKIDVQGTSSQWYVRKNYKLKFNEEFSHIKGSIPAKVFCVKADYAEATSTHNTQNANYVETLYSDKTPAQEVDPRCRTTIQGFPIVIYHKETEDSIPRFLGKYNYNYDKGSESVFGFTDDFDVESWEFKNNTSDACNFTGNIPDQYNIIVKDENGDDQDLGWVNDFERRYPDHDGIKDGDEDPEEAIARFREMHDWVVASGSYDLSDPETLARYREEFQERFNLHKTLVYYIYTFFMLMVDQRAKNMFLTYWGATGKWEPWFYDNDTCLGINNEGQMVFDYYHEDTDYMDDGSKVYNGQDSVLWNNFRIAFADKIQETYQQLRGSRDLDTGTQSGKLNSDILRQHFVTNGSDRWSESIYNEDSDFKYLSMLRSDNNAENVYQITGTGEHHFDYIVDSRINYCDSKWYASDYANDYILLRIYTPEVTSSVIPNANITITPFSNMYAGVRYRANGTLQQKRLAKNETYTFIAPASNFNDTETAIFGASQISSIGDLSPLYCRVCNVSKATKLIVLKLGSEDPNYESILEELSLGTNRLLKKLDIRNCSTLVTPVDLTGCPSIEEVYAEGSGITSLELADSGYLRIVHLPATVSNLTVKNQNYLEEFTMTSYRNIKELNIERSPGLPLADILNNTPALQRVRLINVEWETTEDHLQVFYDRFTAKVTEVDENTGEIIETDRYKIGGYDETGKEVNKSVISGLVKVPSLSSDLLRKLNEAFPELSVSVNGVVLCTVSYFNTDGTLLHVTTVSQGNDAPDPVAEGLIDVPTREADDYYKYAYKGWSDSLSNIQRSKSFVVAYYVSYAVRFFSEDKLVHLEYVDHGESATDPIPNFISVPTKESTDKYEYTFEKWDKSLGDVTEYRDVHAVFIESIRKYSISFYNEDQLLPGYPKEFEYGSAVTYEGELPQKLYVEYPEDYAFLGWTPELVTVTGPASYYANYAPSTHIVDDWATIAQNVANGTYKELYPLGILKRAKLSYNDGTSETIKFEVIGYDHDTLEDGSGTAGITFLCKGVLKDARRMSDSSTLNSAGWDNSELREHLQTTVFSAIESDLRSLIEPVIKYTSEGGRSTTIESTVDSIWLPSRVELMETSEAVYRDEGHVYEYYTGEIDEVLRKRRIKLSPDGREVRYWTRSPAYTSASEYWVGNIVGGCLMKTSYSSQSIAFGFCIGRTPK